MLRARLSARLLRSAGWAVVLAGAAGAGLVAAQPASPPAPQAANQTTPGAGPRTTPPAGMVQAPPEEAPPVNVPPPPPMIVPPISEKEVAPAAPPKDQAQQQQPQKPAEPLRRARYDVAVLQALDKVTAETLVFEAPVGKPIRYKGLIFTVGACERSTPEEPVEDSIAYLTIDSQPRAEAGRPTPPPKQVFKGWMYASSPSLNALQHPVYDAWVISCRAASPAPAATLASR